MFQALHKRLNKDEKGFTLIELMVVVLIIAILIAIAIPTFLGARTKAQDRAAQAALRQSLLTAKSFYTDNETYVATAAQLHALEPSLQFDPVVANASDTVTGFTANAGNVLMERKSKSGTWFCLYDDSSAAGNGTTYGSGAGAGNCDQAAEAAAASW